MKPPTHRGFGCCVTNPKVRFRLHMNHHRVYCTHENKEDYVRRLERSFWKPTQQISEEEFDRLLVPLLGQRYNIELGTMNNRVVLIIDKYKHQPSDNYYQNKTAIVDLLNDWGCAFHIYRELVKKTIELSNTNTKNKDTTIEIDTSIFVHQARN
jgi:hypothetical protein